MRVLVTGATGFLGTNVVHALVEAGGCDVVASGLPDPRCTYLDLPGVETRHADITMEAEVAALMGDVDRVIHVAGDTSFWKKRFARQREINVEGVRHVMQASLDAGVGKVVHVSTVDSLGFNPDGIADETWEEYTYAGWGYNYADTKREGESVALGFVEKGLDVTVINPGSMIGPFDFTLQFGRFFLDIKKGSMPGVLKGGAPWAHVTEVAKALVAALDKGRKGERYICGGVNATYKELFDVIAGSLGVKPPKKVLPRWFLVAYGHLCELGSAVTGKHPEINPGQARYMSAFPRYDSSKAGRELGFTCVPLEKMVVDARDWYVANGFL